MQEILKAVASLPEVSFAADDLLIEEGAPAGNLFVLVAGEVVVLKGQTEMARVSTPGAVFGEVSALLDMPYSASVRAVGPVRARMSEDAARFIAANPTVALHTARILAQRLHAATAYLADVKAQFSEQKDHFGMMDRILDQLMQRQPARTPQARPRSDPRL